MQATGVKEIGLIFYYPLIEQKTKMHAGANSRYSHCFCMLKVQFTIHLESRAGNTLLTDPHEIIYPV